VTLSFVDERQFLNVIPLVLPLHECADRLLLSVVLSLFILLLTVLLLTLLLLSLRLSLFILLLTLLVLVLV
jgi:hypothetical protein